VEASHFFIGYQHFKTLEGARANRKRCEPRTFWRRHYGPV